MRGASSFSRWVSSDALVLRGSKANRQRRDIGVAPRSVFFTEGDSSFSAGMRLRVFSCSVNRDLLIGVSS